MSRDGPFAQYLRTYLLREDQDDFDDPESKGENWEGEGGGEEGMIHESKTLLNLVDRSFFKGVNKAKTLEGKNNVRKLTFPATWIPRSTITP